MLLRFEAASAVTGIVRIILQYKFSRDDNELILFSDQLDIVTVYSDNSLKTNISNERRYTLKVIYTIIIVNISVVCGLPPTLLVALSRDHHYHDPRYITVPSLLDI